jgi:N-hydroxyarylamine O-acetyltransferase
MSNVNDLFRKKLGISENEVITFEKLNIVLEKMARTVPFENLCVLEKRAKDITEENIINKILVHNEGGLCYDLNSILYLFLVENGFEVSLIRGVIYNQVLQRWNEYGSTHVANLVTNDGLLYLVDTGFGGNLPLKPVPLNGETITSSTGEFKVEKQATEYGDYIFFMKLLHKDKEWKMGYAFDTRKRIKDVTELNEVHHIIQSHPDSPFNKSPLVTKLTDNGSVTLTANSLTVWREGQMEKKEIDKQEFKEIARKHFGINSF